MSPRSVTRPLRLLVFFGLLFLVRGLPALFLYRGHLSLTERWQMVLLTPTALPLLVAVTEAGIESGLMLPENAAALVGAGALSVLVFPLVAVGLQARVRSAGEANRVGVRPASPQPFSRCRLCPRQQRTAPAS